MALKSILLKLLVVVTVFTTCNAWRMHLDKDKFDLSMGDVLEVKFNVTGNMDE